MKLHIDQHQRQKYNQIKVSTNTLHIFSNMKLQISTAKSKRSHTETTYNLKDESTDESESNPGYSRVQIIHKHTTYNLKQ